MSAVRTNTSTQARWPLVNSIINQRLHQAVPHMQQTLSLLINVMKSGLIATLLNERPTCANSSFTQGIPVSRYVKVIKIHHDFSELCSQMYCHVFLWFTVQMHIYFLANVQTHLTFCLTNIFPICKIKDKAGVCFIGGPKYYSESIRIFFVIFR